jgi:hypothetical protein
MDKFGIEDGGDQVRRRGCAPSGTRRNRLQASPKSNTRSIEGRTRVPASRPCCTAIPRNILPRDRYREDLPFRCRTSQIRRYDDAASRMDPQQAGLPARSAYPTTLTPAEREEPAPAQQRPDGGCRRARSPWWEPGAAFAYRLSARRAGPMDHPGRPPTQSRAGQPAKRAKKSARRPATALKSSSHGRKRRSM